MSPLVEFLLARIADDEARDRDEFLAGIPEERTTEAVAAWDRLGATAALRVSIAMRQIGWSICDTFGLRRRLLAKKAAEYADHPDYREEWRPVYGRNGVGL